MTRLSKNAVTVLERRYLARNEASELIETPEGMFRRVADAIAAGDKAYAPDADVAALSDKFYEIMTELLFMPNSPTLMNAGKPLSLIHI